MQNKTRKISSALFLGTCLLLSGCGDSGPPDSVVKKLVKQDVIQYEMTTNKLLNFGNSGPQSNGLTPDQKAKLDSLDIKVGAKTKQADGSYDVVVTASGATQIIDFVKGANGWQLINNNQ